MSNNALEFLEHDVVSAARRLLGCELSMQKADQHIRLRIVETEAYHQTDAASHSYKGKTPRTEVMFGPPGRLYVYFTYGMHYCMNIVAGGEGEGSAVLIRAAEPLEGWELLRANRPGLPDTELTNGPAKLCKALGIDKTWNGHDLQLPPLLLSVKPEIPASATVQTTRIGISQAKDIAWRFYIKDSTFISKK